MSGYETVVNRSEVRDWPDPEAIAVRAASVRRHPLSGYPVRGRAFIPPAGDAAGSVPTIRSERQRGYGIGRLCASDRQRSAALIADRQSCSAGCPRCSAFATSQIAMNVPARASSTSKDVSDAPRMRPTSPFRLVKATCAGSCSAALKVSTTFSAFSEIFHGRPKSRGSASPAFCRDRDLSSRISAGTYSVTPGRRGRKRPLPRIDASQL